MAINWKNIFKIVFGLGAVAALPLILSWVYPQFKWIFFLVIVIEIWSLTSRILPGKILTLVVSGFLVYWVYKLWVISAPLVMLYWVAGSLGFGMIGSIIVFGLPSRG